MKTAYIFGITLVFITLVFVFASANFNQPKAATHNLSAASLSQRIPTPSPTAGGISEVGSTGGIVIMGVVLVVIVTVPLLFRRSRNKIK